MRPSESESDGQSLEVERDSGARVEFAELMRRHQSQMFAYLHSLLRDFNDADDLFQQTAVILWRKFDQYDPARGFAAWACGVARFEVSNFLRTRGRSRLYFSDELNLMLVEAQDQIATGELDDRREALLQCLEKLRERDRDLIQACYREDETRVAAIAARDGRSSHSVHNSLRRIRQSLFECIERTLSQAAKPRVAP